MNSLIMYGDHDGRFIVRHPSEKELEAAPKAVAAIETIVQVLLPDGSTVPMTSVSTLDFNACVALWKVIRELAPPPAPIAIPKPTRWQRFIEWLNEPIVW
jgi:hypothetical protein